MFVLKDIAAAMDCHTGLRVKAPRGRPQVVWAAPGTTELNDRLEFETDEEYQAAKKLAEAAPAWFKNFGT